MKWSVLLLLAVATAIVVVPTSALARQSAAQANSATFADSTGENPNAPDITSIALSNDDAGLMTFKVNIGNRPALTPDMAVILYLDTDQQASTGDADVGGADYVIELDQGFVGLAKWNGTDFDNAPSQSSVTYGYDATGATVRVSAADLGGTKAVNFAVVALSGIAVDASGNVDFTNVQADVAPDPGHGMFSYQVVTKLTLTAVAFTTTPKPAKAGKAFVASLAANESDTSGPVQAGTVACSATAGGVHLVARTHRVANGIATCAWSVPAKAKGKILRGTISLTVRGTTLTRSFAVKVS